MPYTAYTTIGYGTDTAGTTSSVITTTVAAAAGSLLLAPWVSDNIGTTGPTLNSVSGKPAGETNNWVILVPNVTSPVTANNGGINGGLAALITTVAWPINVNVTFTFSGGVPKRVIDIVALTGTGFTTTLRGSLRTVTDTTGAALDMYFGPTLAGDILIGGAFVEGDGPVTASNSNTTGTSYDRWCVDSTTGGGAASNVYMRWYGGNSVGTTTDTYFGFNYGSAVDGAAVGLVLQREEDYSLWGYPL